MSKVFFPVSSAWDGDISGEGSHRCWFISWTLADGNKAIIRCASGCSATFRHNSIILGLNVLAMSIKEQFL